MLVVSKIKINLTSLALFVGLFASCANHSSPPDLEDTLVAEGHVQLQTWNNELGYMGVDIKTSEGVSYRFIVDTGASVSLVDLPAAAELGITGSKRIEHLDIGGFSGADLQLNKFDLDIINQGLIANGAEPIDGVLGAPALTKFRAIFDYHSHRLYLSSQPVRAEFATKIATQLSDQEYLAVPLTHNPVSFIELVVQINGEGPYNFIVDTGAVATTLSLPVAESLALDIQPSASPAITVGGALAAFEAQVQRLDVGTMNVGAQNIAVIDLSSFSGQLEQVGARPLDGLVGSEFLRTHAAVIFYEGSQLFLRAAAENRR